MLEISTEVFRTHHDDRYSLYFNGSDHVHLTEIYCSDDTRKPCLHQVLLLLHICPLFHLC